MFGKDKDKQKKKKEKMNDKAGHSEENYNVLYDNLAFPEVYAKEQKQSDTEETDEEPVNYDNVATYPIFSLSKTFYLHFCGAWVYRQSTTALNERFIFIPYNNLPHNRRMTAENKT